jgi:hypothetical protein
MCSHAKAHDITQCQIREVSSHGSPQNKVEAIDLLEVRMSKLLETAQAWRITRKKKNSTHVEIS